jgi:hypothetical protein
MPQRAATQNVAEDLCRLAAEFQSGDPNMAKAIRGEFKQQSKNDLTRVVVYLMEVIGSRDEHFKKLQDENKDLKELLTLNGVKLDGEDATPSTEGQNGVAATGITQDIGSGGTATSSTPTVGTGDVVDGTTTLSQTP